MFNFTVLISIYSKETPGNFYQCLDSLKTQTLPASEIIIVKDGLLTNELEDILETWQEKLPLKIIGYEENKGLAYALNYGLNYCTYEFIARMDSDDICMPERFEKQIKFLEENNKISLLSGYISEFKEVPNDIVSIRKVPTGSEKIVRFLKRRNAFNHMTVMFKKSAVIAVGGYNEIDGFEDYDLWIRLTTAGYHGDNIPDILVYARIGNGMVARRSGVEYAKRELAFLVKQKNNKFISPIEFLLQFILKMPIRLIPQNIISHIYTKYLRTPIANYKV